uniref:Peptidase A1 domain-containing protein n=1 Tax=Peronospora matthiolae TaxID=2874970 RepID=A0AAV1UGI9_9STRA
MATFSNPLERVPMWHDSLQNTHLRRLVASAKDDSSVVELVNYQGTIYFADLELNGTTYVVQVDTGSSDLWIACYSIKYLPCDSTCPLGARTISYGSGDVCVLPTIADVKFGNVAIPDYSVGVAYGNHASPRSTTSLLVGEAKGLFGLAYRSLATFPSPRGQVIDYVTDFSMYLTRKDDAKGSFLLLNGVDDDLIATNDLVPHTIDLKSTTLTHWTIGMTALQIGKDEAVFPCSESSRGSCDSIVDSGTSLLVMPSSIYSDFVTRYLSSCTLYSAGSEVYVCSKDVALPRLALTFGYVTFYLEKEDYMMDLGNNVMVVEVQSASGTSANADTWIIGGTFLKAFYTRYNVNESVTFYCKENSTCTSGSKAVSLPASSRDDSRSNGLHGNNDGGVTSRSDGNDHLTMILAIVLAILVFLLTISAVSCLFRCICRRKRASRHERSLDPILDVPDDYNQSQSAIRPYQGHYARL